MSSGVWKDSLRLFALAVTLSLVNFTIASRNADTR